MTIKLKKLDLEVEKNEIKDILTKNASSFLARFDSTGKKYEKAIDFLDKYGIDINDRDQLYDLWNDVDYLIEVMSKKIKHAKEDNEKEDYEKMISIYEDLQDLSTGILYILLEPYDLGSDCKPWCIYVKKKH